MLQSISCTNSTTDNNGMMNSHSGNMNYGNSFGNNDDQPYNSGVNLPFGANSQPFNGGSFRVTTDSRNRLGLGKGGVN